MAEGPTRYGFEPDYAVPPGETILEEFACRLGLTGTQFCKLLGGWHPIDKELAEALRREIGSSPQFWLNLEANYRAALKRRAENPARHGFKLPISEVDGPRQDYLQWTKRHVASGWVVEAAGKKLLYTFLCEDEDAACRVQDVLRDYATGLIVSCVHG